MDVFFSKYQGTGNDFVMIDNRSGKWDHLSLNSIRAMCDRRFGIGADGLIKLNSSEGYDFEVDYYNSDGSKSFCGNGARCAVAFAKSKGINTAHVKFVAIDGEHEASQVGAIVSLLMNDVNAVNLTGKDYVLNTGSPHYVQFVKKAEQLDVFEEGKKIRYSETYKEKGINVNFVETLGKNELYIRTYERGVEDETLSCGTGVTAAALAYAVKEKLYDEHLISIKTRGGQLQVRFTRTGEETFSEIFLIGPAVKVFEGEYNASL